MLDIIPAIIPQSLQIVREKFSQVVGAVKKVQMDITDGEYAESKTWPFVDKYSDDLRRLAMGEERFPFINDFILEVDMLVLHPIEYISDFIALGAKSFVIHLDSTNHLKECLETIKAAGCEVGIGIKPSGNVEVLENHLTQADFVQFMGNDKVGYNGVVLDESVLEKIKNFHERHPSVPIQIDIGVNEETIPRLKSVGVSRFISGSAVFNTPDPKVAIMHLQSL